MVSWRGSERKRASTLRVFLRGLLAEVDILVTAFLVVTSSHGAAVRGRSRCPAASQVLSGRRIPSLS